MRKAFGHGAPIGFEQAHATLCQGARFLAMGLQGEGAGAIDGSLRAKVIGNGLRELDRFLNVLLDELARTASSDRLSLPRLGRMRNTPNKLVAVCGASAVVATDLARLRALGRSRDCLFHCGGAVRRGDERGGDTLLAGWPREGEGIGEAVAIGGQLRIGPADLAWIGRFYTRIGAELAATSVRRQVLPARPKAMS